MPHGVLRRTQSDAAVGSIIDLGPVMSESLAETPLPPCPDCGGVLLWVEASRGPGARERAQSPEAADPNRWGKVEKNSPPERGGLQQHSPQLPHDRRALRGH